MNTIIGRVVKLARVGNTVEGNPQWLVELDDGYTYRLGKNSDLCYRIENNEYWNEAHAFEVTDLGRIMKEKI